MRYPENIARNTAFQEGVADVVPIAVSYERTNRRTFFGHDLELPTEYLTGIDKSASPFIEQRNASVLWDLFDNTPDEFYDDVSMPIAEIIDILKQNAPSSIVEFYWDLSKNAIDNSRTDKVFLKNGFDFFKQKAEIISQHKGQDETVLINAPVNSSAKTYMIILDGNSTALAKSTANASPSLPDTLFSENPYLVIDNDKFKAHFFSCILLDSLSNRIYETEPDSLLKNEPQIVIDSITRIHQKGDTIVIMPHGYVGSSLKYSFYFTDGSPTDARAFVVAENNHFKIPIDSSFPKDESFYIRISDTSGRFGWTDSITAGSVGTDGTIRHNSVPTEPLARIYSNRLLVFVPIVDGHGRFEISGYSVSGRRLFNETSANSGRWTYWELDKSYRSSIIVITITTSRGIIFSQKLIGLK